MRIYQPPNLGHEIPVLLLGLLAPALECPAVDQATRAVDAEDVLGAGDLAGPSLGMESYTHGGIVASLRDGCKYKGGEPS